MNPRIASLALATFSVGFSLGVLVSPGAHASPDNDCDLYDVRLCNPSHVRYCPDTHTQISAFEPCPNLIFGPNLPGHDQDDQDDE